MQETPWGWVGHRRKPELLAQGQQRADEVKKLGGRGCHRAPPLVLTDPNRQWQKEMALPTPPCWSNLSDTNMHYLLDYTVPRKEHAALT